MTPENSFTDPALERAMTEIRSDTVETAVMEAAAARVWAKLADAASMPAEPVGVSSAAEHIRGCADFQALFPEYRAGRLPQARALLVQDHLHQCVACRRVYEGKVVAMPTAPATALPTRSRHIAFWAAAAAAAVIGVSVYIYTDFSGVRTGPAVVQALNGRLYVVTNAGFQPLAAGQQFPEGSEIRTAQDSDAVLRLRDGSQVELRERSGFSTSASGRDLTVRLLRGSVIVEAAKRRTGHLYVDTADCRVAVTGTIFGVSSGVKGSRVSVIAGQVHVTEGSSDKLLKPGDQAVTSELQPEPVRNDIAWSRNRDRYYALLGLGAALEKVHLPDLRYTSHLLGRLPADTVVFASIPNLADYLGQVESIFNEKMTQNPALGQYFGERGGRLMAVLEQLRNASGYLGDEVAMVGTKSGGAPVLFAEVKRDGFPQFLAGLGMNLAVESRNGFVVFGPDRNSVERLAPVMDVSSGAFQGTPFYARIQQAYIEGAGLLLCADLSRMQTGSKPSGMRYLIAEEKEVEQKMEARASVGFDGSPTGPMAWLADPGPMGSLDYITTDASALGAFVVRNPDAILDQITGAVKSSPADIGAAAPDVQAELHDSLGGEFAFAMDGPLVPVPSWKLIIEVYDPARVENAIEHLVADFNQRHNSGMVQSLTLTHETGEGGAIYYTLAATPKNPLTEAHYTFSGGYMIAAPNRALVQRALQTKQAGTSILRSSKFLAMTPRDHYANFSAVIYHDMGSQLAPIAGLFSGIAGKNMPSLTDLKPMLFAIYSEPDAITIASNSDVLGATLGRFLSGDRGGWAEGLIPFAQGKNGARNGGPPLPWNQLQFQGTRERKPAYR